MRPPPTASRRPARAPAAALARANSPCTPGRSCPRRRRRARRRTRRRHSRRWRHDRSHPRCLRPGQRAADDGAPRGADAPVQVSAAQGVGQRARDPPRARGADAPQAARRQLLRPARDDARGADRAVRERDAPLAAAQVLVVRGRRRRRRRLPRRLRRGDQGVHDARPVEARLRVPAAGPPAAARARAAPTRRRSSRRASFPSRCTTQSRAGGARTSGRCAGRGSTASRRPRGPRCAAGCAR